MAIAFPHHKLFVIPEPPEAEMNVISKALTYYKIRAHDGSALVAFPIHSDVTRLLANLNIDVSGCSPFEVFYPIPVNAKGETAWWWQLVTAKFLIDNKRAFCTSTPRTGKTFSTLMAIDYLQRFERVQAAVVVAPFTVANKGAWHETASEWLPHKRVQLVHKNRTADLNTPADIYLINPEAIKLVARELKRKIDLGQINIVVIDELTEFANHKNQRWAALNDAAQNALYRWGLTGSPGSSQKIYGEVKLINPSRVPATYSAWRDKTQVKKRKIKSVTSKHTNRVFDIYDWEDKPDVDSIIQEAMQPCIRFDKAAIMEIPLPEVVSIEVPLTAEQQKLTDTLREQLRVGTEANTITALQQNILAQKLMQVSNGAVITDSGEVHRVDASHKIEKLIELLKQTDRKKLVYSNYIAVNDMLVEAIRAAGFSCEKIDGSVTGKRRTAILRQFMESADPHALVCHPRTTAYGVELAAADYIICFGTPLCGTYLYQQLAERLSSSKQTADKTFIVHLSAGKQDVRTRDALLHGANVEQDLVKLFNYSW